MNQNWKKLDLKQVHKNNLQNNMNNGVMGGDLRNQKTKEESKTPKATESNLSEVELGASFFRALGPVGSPSNASNHNVLFRNSLAS